MSDAPMIRPALTSFPNFLSIIISIENNAKFRSDSSSLLSKTSIIFPEMRKNANLITKAKRCDMARPAGLEIL